MTLNNQPDFNKYPDQLVPAIIQDAVTQKVLMLGYMNPEALETTLQSGRITFYSRSRQQLWTKGDTSGNWLQLVSIMLDCDQDALLVKAYPQGPVCHTGADTCFGEGNKAEGFLAELEGIIRDRKNNPDGASYVSGLFKKGINKIAQKVGEEAVELVIEAKDNDATLFQNEAADLLFHYLILLQAKGFSLKEIESVLQERHTKR